jgi:hypothetical protein
MIADRIFRRDEASADFPWLEFLLTVTRIYAQNRFQVNSKSVVQSKKVIGNFPKSSRIKKTLNTRM